MTRDEALQILNDLVDNQNLIKHMLAVEACMRFYAQKFNEDPEKWAIAGLLHDADWEKYPDEHPQVLLQMLRDRTVDPTIIEAINGHGGKNPIPRLSNMAKALFACDEASGMVTATALMRPNKLADLDVSSVLEKMKDKSFAKGVRREDLIQGAEELGIPLEEHLSNVIEAMRGIRGELGL
jgi:putative nucleotidyltransferase with HDIG domain